MTSHVLHTDPGYRHYLYRLRDPSSGAFYVGVRSCKSDPAADRAYRGSGNWPRWMAFDRVLLSKDVLAELPSRALAEEAEMLLIDMVAGTAGCKNSWKSASTEIRAVLRGRCQ